jgi:DNA polymerase III epsilon subunit-like protein
VNNPRVKNIIQISFVDFEGQVIATQNINPEVCWEDRLPFLGYVSKCWGCTKFGVVGKAKSLPTFKQAMPEVLAKLAGALGPNIILAGHNSHAWDAIVLQRQMKEADITLPFSVKSFDTRRIVAKLRKKSVDDHKWNLGYVYQRAFSEDIKRAHTAEADAQALARMIRAHASDRNIRCESKAVNQLVRFEPLGFNAKAFDGCWNPPKTKKEKFDADFKEMVAVLETKKGPLDFSDSEIEKIRDTLSKLAL